jgi:hypothetical protein
MSPRQPPRRPARTCRTEAEIYAAGAEAGVRDRQHLTPELTARVVNIAAPALAAMAENEPRDAA